MAQIPAQVFKDITRHTNGASIEEALAQIPGIDGGIDSDAMVELAHHTPDLMSSCGIENRYRSPFYGVTSTVAVLPGRMSRYSLVPVRVIGTTEPSA